MANNALAKLPSPEACPIEIARQIVDEPCAGGDDQRKRLACPTGDRAIEAVVPSSANWDQLRPLLEEQSLGALFKYLRGSSRRLRASRIAWWCGSSTTAEDLVTVAPDLWESTTRSSRSCIGADMASSPRSQRATVLGVTWTASANCFCVSPIR